MKLQVNANGAWKNVCEFQASKHAEVRDAATRLGAILGNDGRFCIVDDAGKREWLDTSLAGAGEPRSCQ